MTTLKVKGNLSTATNVIKFNKNGKTIQIGINGKNLGYIENPNIAFKHTYDSYKNIWNIQSYKPVSNDELMVLYTKCENPIWLNEMILHLHMNIKSNLNCVSLLKSNEIFYIYENTSYSMTFPNLVIKPDHDRSIHHYGNFGPLINLGSRSKISNDDLKELKRIVSICLKNGR